MLKSRKKWLAAAFLMLVYQAHHVAGLPDDRDHAQHDSSEEKLSDAKNETENASPPFNVALKTSGGGQFWTDHYWRDGFHIQQNVLTGHWRLLDGENIRRGWGNEKQCLRMLDEKCPAAIEAGEMTSRRSLKAPNK